MRTTPDNHLSAKLRKAEADRRAAKARDPHTLSSVSVQTCECCGKVKPCRMYMLQTCNAAWVCHGCRKGET